MIDNTFSRNWLQSLYEVNPRMTAWCVYLCQGRCSGRICFRQAWLYSACYCYLLSSASEWGEAHQHFVPAFQQLNLPIWWAHSQSFYLKDVSSAVYSSWRTLLKACWYCPGAVHSCRALGYIITITSSGPTVINVAQNASRALEENSKQTCLGS